MRKRFNKKGVAILLVITMVLVAVPVTIVMLNLSTSQKEQTTHFNNLLNVEQISLSGINMGYSKLKSGYDRGYKIFTGEVSGKDSFDLNMTPTGKGFFQQDVYLLLSKAKEGKYSSIIMADAEQFQEESSNQPVLVITHDYWDTPEPYELGVAADVISMKNSRGKDQLRALDVKKFEMECDESTYKNALESLRKSLPVEISSVWDTVVVNASNDKIYGEDTPQPSTPGSGYKTASNTKSSGNKKKNNNKTTDESTNNTDNKNDAVTTGDVSQGLEEMYDGGDTLSSLPTGSTDEEMSNIGLTAEQRAELERIARERSAGDAGSGNYTYNGSGTYGVR